MDKGVGDSYAIEPSLEQRGEDSEACGAVGAVDVRCEAAQVRAVLGGLEASFG
jgi:hypothetical protein